MGPRVPLLDHEQPLRLNEWKGCASLSISGRIQSKHISELERRGLTSGEQAGATVVMLCLHYIDVDTKNV